MNNAFNILDVDATGVVDYEKLKKILPDIDLNKDNSENFKMQYTDFLTHAIDIKNKMNEKTIKKVFEHFDPKGTGKITAEGLSEAFKR